MNSSVVAWLVTCPGINTVLSRYPGLGPILSQSRSHEWPAMIAAYSAADIPHKRDIGYLSQNDK